MPKKFAILQDYLDDKIVFLNWEDNGLILAKFEYAMCNGKY